MNLTVTTINHLDPCARSNFIAALDSDEPLLSVLLKKYPQLADDFEFIHAAVRSRGQNLRLASARLRDDRRIVASACHRNGIALQYASARLKNHWRIARIALNNNCRAIKYVDPQNRLDQRIYPDAFFQTPQFLEFVPFSLRSNKTFIERFLKHSYGSLDGIFQYLPDSLLQDDALCEELMMKLGANFSQAPESLRSNKAFFLQACKHGQPDAYDFLAPPLQQDPECLMAAISLDAYRIYQIADPETFWTLDRARQLCGKNDTVYKLMPLSYRTDRICAQNALKLNPYLYENLPSELALDHQLALMCVTNANVLHLIPPPLNQDPQIIQMAVLHDANSLQCVHISLRTHALCHQALHQSKSNNGYCFEYFPAPVREDISLCQSALKLNGMYYRYVPKKFEQRTDLMLLAVRQDSDALEQLPLYWREQCTLYENDLKSRDPTSTIETYQILLHVIEQHQALQSKKQMEHLLTPSLQQSDVHSNTPTNQGKQKRL